MTADEPKKKKRKNPWHKRRVNQRYNSLCDKIENHPLFLGKVKSMDDLLGDLNKNTDTMIRIRADYEKIMTRKTRGDLMQDLPIDNLEDLYQMEHDGYVSKPRFSDLVKANQLRKQGQEIAENKETLITNIKVAQIDLILAEIDIILKESKS